MEYPEKLVQLVAQRSAGLQLEGFIPGLGPLKPKLMLVGEAPGRNEVENHIPFSGQAGKELMACFALAGLTREDVYMTSSVRSRPFSVKQQLNKRSGLIETKTPNRTPNSKEVLAHAPLLDYEISVIQPRLIVTVGNIGLHRLLGKEFNVTKDHGQLFEHKVLELTNAQDAYQWSKQQYLILPTYHPAAVFYNRKLQPLIEADWRKIGATLKELGI